MVCSKKFYDQNKELFSSDYTYPLIMPTSSEKRRNLEEYLNNKNIKYQTIVELPNSILLKNLILKDLGIGYINKKFISSEINKKNVIVLSEFKDCPQDNITIIYNEQNMNETIKNFIKLIKELLKK